MNNNELDQEYVYLKLAGKLKGTYRERDHYDKINNDWDFNGSKEDWHTEEEMRDIANLISCELNEDCLIDMPYEEWLIANANSYLFDW